MNKSVWVFNGEGERWVTAVFSTREEAERWLERKKRVGILTKFDLDIGESDRFPEHYHCNYPD